MNQWRKRNPIKDYFPLPNEVFYLGLVPGELAVYAYLLTARTGRLTSAGPVTKPSAKR